MPPCWCCERRLSSAPWVCMEGWCLRCGLCPACCQCASPWITSTGDDDGYLWGEDDDDADEPLVIDGQPET